DEWTRARMAELGASGVTTPGATSRALVRRTVSERLADPAMTLRLLACKARDWLRPYPHPLFLPRPGVLAVGAFYVALSLLAVRGLVLAPRRRASLFALAFLVVTMAAHV